MRLTWCLLTSDSEEYEWEYEFWRRLREIQNIFESQVKQVSSPTI